MKYSGLCSRALLFAVGCSSIFFPIQAQLTLANLTKYTVIQRDSNSSTATFTITGTCQSSAANILIQVTNQDSNKVVAPFSWLQTPSTITGTTFSATAYGLPVGGPYVIQLRSVDGSGNTLDNSAADSSVIVGDVWLCEGQSNMQLYSGVTSNPDAKHIHVRALFYDGNPRAARYTRNDTSHWAVGMVDGPCMTFAQKIYQMSSVPVGIMYGSAGGSAFSAWDTSWFPDTKKFVSQACNWRIGGFLWYQGEAEDPIDCALVYKAKFDTICAIPSARCPTIPSCRLLMFSLKAGPAPVTSQSLP